MNSCNIFVMNAYYQGAQDPDSLAKSVKDDAEQLQLLMYILKHRKVCQVFQSVSSSKLIITVFYKRKFWDSVLRKLGLRRVKKSDGGFKFGEIDKSEKVES